MSGIKTENYSLFHVLLIHNTCFIYARRNRGSLGFTLLFFLSFYSLWESRIKKVALHKLLFCFTSQLNSYRVHRKRLPPVTWALTNHKTKLGPTLSVIFPLCFCVFRATVLQAPELKIIPIWNCYWRGSLQKTQNHSKYKVFSFVTDFKVSVKFKSFHYSFSKKN